MKRTFEETMVELLYRRLALITGGRMRIGIGNLRPEELLERVQSEKGHLLIPIPKVPSVAGTPVRSIVTLRPPTA